MPGVTYSLDNASTDFAEIDSNGILRLKSTASWDANESSSLKLKNITVVADIPNEGLVSKQIQIEPKNIEKQENLVMKFASGFNNVDHNFIWKSIFSPGSS